ncbi:hypothetical protein D1831_08080 [Lactiplantibacillus garii]|uniref:Gram-positive cocci surface proteins LPxTG domain-containing protein n=1 Tax=Lactiplantibacillus garii TaxID=2306423 RepID=A0A426D6R8_9LACO|nr:hypothetical protein [Lactiplantibacillus garii]RRK10335.1 hypothetical protein D1831_08080 [Lactiplantibacillus garii]
MIHTEPKTRFKMYRTHKGWLIAGITVTSMGLFISSPHKDTLAQASETSTPATTTSSSATVTANKTVTLPATSSHPKTTEPTTPATTATSTQDSSAPTTTVTGKTTGTTTNGTGVTHHEQPAPTTASTATPAPTEKSTSAPLSPNTAPEQPQASRSVAPASSAPSPSSFPSSQENTRPHSTTTIQPTALKTPYAAAVPESTPVQTGINVTDPSKLTNQIKGQSAFNVSKTNQLQYTYDHTDANGVSSDLRVIDGYNSKHQVQGTGAWLGETYATKIAADAKGYDYDSPFTSPQLYIDEWLPDSGLQYFIWQNNFASKYATFADFRNNFTKADLATVTDITTTEAQQATTANGTTPTQYYYALMSMKSLEGLQNATSLETLYPNVSVSSALFGTPMKNGNLWDIRALKDIQTLKSVDIALFSISDISALGHKPNLTHVGLPYNQIANISPLATDTNLDIKANAELSQQHILLAPITLNTKLESGKNSADGGVYAYTTPSFIVKDLKADNLPIRGFDNAEHQLYPTLYPSSSDTGNANSNTLTWYNLLNNSKSQNYGSLSTTWADTNSSFAGYIIQPYDLAENTSELVVNVQLLQANGQQLNLGPATVISGQIGDTVNVQKNATVMTLLNQQLSDGYQFSGLILDGTGLYSDYIAGNGKANAQASWSTTLEKETKNWTILFYKDVLPWNLTVQYGSMNTDGQFVAITDPNSADATYTGTSDATLVLSDYDRDFPNYVLQKVETSADNVSWRDISQDVNVPFDNSKQTVRFVYVQAHRATVTVKDLTTGKTLQTLDYQTNPELRGAIGTTSTFDATALIKAYLAKGYRLVQDGTKNADGSSTIIFDQANQNYDITLAHNFVLAPKTVSETIRYQDQTGTLVATNHVQTINFTTTTDQVTGNMVIYVNHNATADLALDQTGQPTDASWTVYVAGKPVQFATVNHPHVTNLHVIATSADPSDLTAIIGPTVTNASDDLTYTVTYGHDFTQTTTHVAERVHYVDVHQQIVAPTTTQELTFLTVHDTYTATDTSYYQVGHAMAAAVDENGRPIDQQWQQFHNTVNFAAVVNPVIDHLTVHSTTDPAQNLAQVVAQPVTPQSADLAFTVTYAHDFATHLKLVTETINYNHLDGEVAATSARHDYTFATITDLYTDQVGMYVTTRAATTITLDKFGQPNADWQPYATGTPLVLNAVVNPVIANAHVVATTDPAQDLTQVTAQTITDTTQPLRFTVTYGHDFTVRVTPVTETIRYQDTAGHPLATEYRNSMTFATVTDQFNQQVRTYSHAGTATTLELDTHGIPTSNAWDLYTPTSNLQLPAVTHPVITGATVIRTTDPSANLTAVTAKPVMPATTDQALHFTVTYAHQYHVQTTRVTATIRYQDRSGKPVAPTNQRTTTFATLTDQLTNQATIYHHAGFVATPTWDENGQPLDSDWTRYTQPITLAAVAHPSVADMRVVATTESPQDLAQITAQHLTPTSANLNFTVTYDGIPHTYTATTRQVRETIHYQDKAGQPVAVPKLQVITFLTVTDQTSQQTVTYTYAGAATVPSLNAQGQPLTADWTIYSPALTFAAVLNPVVSGMHVTATTDHANDLTQVTAQLVQPASNDLAFVVTYAADQETTEKPDKVTPPTDVDKPAPEQPEPEQPITEQPDTKQPRPNPSLPQLTHQPAPLNLKQRSPQVPTTTVQPLAARSVKPARAFVKPTPELPRTNEQAERGLITAGLALLVTLLGAAGFKRRH